MKKFFVVLLATLALALGTAVAEQRNTTEQWALTVTSRTDVQAADGSILGYRMEATSGTHEFYLACLKEYKDCSPLAPNSGEFQFKYLDNAAVDAYPLAGTAADGNVVVITGDGTRVVLFYINK